MRISKKEYYLNIAMEVAKRSTCLRRHYGAIIVQMDQIISTGYAGSPRGTKNCMDPDVNFCKRQELNAKPGEHYEWCRSVHAEQNAIISAPRLNMIDSVLYLVGLDARTQEIVPKAEPCMLCKRMIINAGIKEVIVKEPEGELAQFVVQNWVENNIGELEKKGDRYRPVNKSGY